MGALVMGIGNILLMDEAAGVKVIENLLSRYIFPADVEVIDGGTMGIELLDYLQNKQHVYVADAAKTGNVPGTVVRLEKDAVPAFFTTKISPHQLGLSDLLAVAMLTNSMPENIIFFGIEPKIMETGLDLSEEVQGKISGVADMIVKELRMNGYNIEAKG
ncbi:MAG: HyaD/HybD family hydrogenase maturation endopeptidase [Nitrospirae bacterium]|nr:HyaD/HybD family hydrogenase maturation endopeptidase [Nitrospirota bacterium]